MAARLRGGNTTSPTIVSVDPLTARVEKALTEFLDEATPPLVRVADELGPLGDAARAFVLQGGKRLRPLFCYWGYHAPGADDGEEIVRAAAALERLHACALVHDDVIGGSGPRRGAPAVQRKFAALHRTSQWHGDPERFGEA